MSVEKMTVAEQVQTRKELYAAAITGLDSAGFPTETISEGALVMLPDGQYAVMKVTIKDPAKFDLEQAREEYAEKQRKNAERAEEKAKKAAEKAEKERAKANAAEEKATKGDVVVAEVMELSATTDELIGF